MPPLIFVKAKVVIAGLLGDLRTLKRTTRLATNVQDKRVLSYFSQASSNPAERTHVSPPSVTESMAMSYQQGFIPLYRF